MRNPQICTTSLNLLTLYPMRPPESLEWFLKHAEQSQVSDGMANSFVACSCWACGSPIRVHMNITPNNIYIPPSQCGQCGALTDHPDSGPPKISQVGFVKNLLRLLSGCGRGVVAAVTVLVLTVVTLGSVVILPVTCASSDVGPHHPNSRTTSFRSGLTLHCLSHPPCSGYGPSTKPSHGP